MTDNKQLGYDITAVLWNELIGFEQIWNGNEATLKDSILEKIGSMASKSGIKNRMKKSEFKNTLDAIIYAETPEIMIKNINELYKDIYGK